MKSLWIPVGLLFLALLCIVLAARLHRKKKEKRPVAIPDPKDYLIVLAHSDVVMVKFSEFLSELEGVCGGRLPKVQVFAILHLLEDEGYVERHGEQTRDIDVVADLEIPDSVEFSLTPKGLAIVQRQPDKGPRLRPRLMMRPA